MKSCHNSHILYQTGSANAKTKLGRECICQIAQPNRPTNQRTEKKKDAKTTVLQKRGFRASNEVQC